MSLPAEIRAEAERYYPALVKQPLTAHGQFESAQSIVRWRNFSDLEFHEDKAKAMFDFLAGLALQQPEREVRLAGRSFRIGFRLVQVSDRFIYMVPPNIQFPRHIVPEAQDTGAATWLPPREPTTVTYIKVASPKFHLPYSYAREVFEDCNVSFYTEAAQSVLDIGAETLTFARALKEHFNNGLGIAMFERQRESYTGYRIRASSILSGNVPFLPGVHRNLVFSEEEFERIPKTGHVLTS